MKKIFAIVITLAMLLSLGAIMANAAVIPDGISAPVGKYGVANPDDFSPVGTIKIQWDADASKKLDLTDGDMADWANYEGHTIDASNMVSWVGDHTTAPENWNITTYFVADSEWLYIGFYVTDPNFAYGTPQAYSGDAFQICIDFGGKLGEKVAEDPDSLTNPKNIFYSFSCVEDGAPIEIMRQESDNDGWLSAADEDSGIQGAARKTSTGWSAEFALSFEMMFDDYEWKAWEEDSKIYVGGDDNDPLKIGCCLYYLDRSETSGDIYWAAGSSSGVTNVNGEPVVSWTCYDNGIQLELDIEDGVTFADENIVILAAGETAPSEEEEEEEEEDPVEDATTAPADVATDAPTDAATDAPTAGGDDVADVGCASVVGFGAAAVLAAAAAAFVLKKKD